MNNLTKTLLGSAALIALTAVPALAENFRVPHLIALHAGKRINKTKLPNNRGAHIYSTFSVFTYQPANAPRKTHLSQTFYDWIYDDFCDVKEQRIKAPKRSIYAKIGTAIETYSVGCLSGPGTFYGDTWTNKTGQSRDVDTFVSSVFTKFTGGGTHYRGTVTLDVNVIVE